MDLIKYRKYVVDNILWEKMKLDVSDWIDEYLSPMSVSCKNRFEKINHPLVNSGDAYWIDNKTLCLGYMLKSDSKTVMPIFNHNKQLTLKNLQTELKIYNN